MAGHKRLIKRSDARAPPKVINPEEGNKVCLNAGKP
jgi:hypothetical protein